MSAEPVPANTLPLHHSWVGNAPVIGRAGLRDSVNPSTGEAWATASLLDAAQAGDVIAAAEAAGPAWASLGFERRGQILLRARDLVMQQADELAALIQREQGKPAVEAFVVELFPAMEHLKHLARHAEEVLADEPVESRVVLLAHKECRLAYVPYGVVLAITPWNYPFGIAMSGVAAALAAGNTVVLKPAPAATVIGLRIGELFRDAGLPAGVLGVVAVDDAVAPSLVADPRVRKIVFTGSVATGKRVMATAAGNLTPVVLELGGKDPAVVCADADLDRAAEGIAWASFVNCGQTCASVERVYVDASVAEPFLERLVARVRTLRVGDPARAEVDMGPMTMARQRRIVEEHVADAVARGAKVLTGGATPEGPGFFYPPTVLTGVTQDMRIVREETFGPVLPVMQVGSVDEAIRLANDSDYGLTASGWTRDPETAAKLQAGLRAGVVTINDHLSSYGEPTAPWGGFRSSGVGRAHGTVGLREMVQVKYVTNDDTRGPSIWWFPYDAELRGLVAAANRGLYGRGFLTRVGGLLRLAGFRRLWRRGNLTGMAGSADRLID